VIAAEIDGWVTYNRAAAPEIEPSRATVRKLVSWWSVIGIRETLWKDAVL